LLLGKDRKVSKSPLLELNFTGSKLYEILSQIIYTMLLDLERMMDLLLATAKWKAKLLNSSFHGITPSTVYPLT
jgi:hypothetical protein